MPAFTDATACIMNKKGVSRVSLGVVRAGVRSARSKRAFDTTAQFAKRSRRQRYAPRIWPRPLSEIDVTEVVLCVGHQHLSLCAFGTTRQAHAEMRACETPVSLPRPWSTPTPLLCVVHLACAGN